MASEANGCAHVRRALGRCAGGSAHPDEERASTVADISEQPTSSKPASMLNDDWYSPPDVVRSRLLSLYISDALHGIDLD
jgi:hypothetical protein